jgi:hypothetical protein
MVGGAQTPDLKTKMEPKLTVTAERVNFTLEVRNTHVLFETLFTELS